MTARQPIDELSRLLGAIEAKVDLVTKTQSEDRTASASWRTDIRTKMDGIRDDLSELKGSVRDVTGRVNDMEPSVQLSTQERAERRGISRVGHLAAALGGGGVAVALQWLLRKLGG